MGNTQTKEPTPAAAATNNLTTGPSSGPAPNNNANSNNNNNNTTGSQPQHQHASSQSHSVTSRARSSLDDGNVGVPIKKNNKYSVGASQPLFGSPLVSPINASYFSQAAHMPIGSDMEGKDKNTIKTFPIVFVWNHGGENVSILGTFNNWTPTSLPHSGQDFAITLDLPVGMHRFRFLVDNEIRCSPEFPTVPDSTGNLVNYIEITKDGFQTDLDILDSISSQTGMNDDDFTQDIPPPNPSTSDPPLLPPHLNKIILNSVMNSDNPLLSDTGVLPVPHPVMLNHLYALSIRDGVMVLSTTTRYKKKYFTTVMYKPVFT